jgi:serine/threonine protein kinase/Tol biopolymer transport system component
MRMSEGTRFGFYEIVALLGAGGMGEVYRAKDTKLGRDVALKILPASFTNDPERVARFLREAQVLASLDHPHIAQIYGLEEANDTHFLVLELVDGESLDKRIGRGPIPVDEALGIAKQIAEALEAAHEKGIVHRDLKPANIALTKDGSVKVLDFGLAKAVEATSGSVDTMNSPTIASPGMTTSVGVILGTAGYMAPEQLRTQSADHRSDIFSLGAVVYEMLTGRRAFRGETPIDAITATLRENPPAIPSVTPDVPTFLVRIVGRCLEKSPRARFQSASEFAFALEALCSDAGTTPRQDRASRTRRRLLIPMVTVSAGLAPSDAGARSRQDRASRTLRRLLIPMVTVSAGLALVAAASRLFGSLNRTLPDEGVLPPDGWTVSGRSLAISPDGRFVVFEARAKDGKALLWLHPLGAQGAQPLNATDSAVAPFWSPDSRQLAFFTQDEKLKIINVAGGAPVTVCDACGPGEGAWSTTGVIVLARGQNHSLQRVPASGGTPTPVTTLENGEIGHVGPRFLPDGRRFIFKAIPARDRASQRSTYVGSLEPSTPRHDLNVDWSQPLYSAGHVLFVRETTLMAQPFDARTLTVRGEAFPVVEQIRAADRGAIFSASENATLAYQTTAAVTGTQVVWFSRSGNRIGSIGERGDYEDVELSPDGTKVAVSALDVGQNNRDIWVVDVARGVGRRLTTGKYDVAPIWSRDGRNIVYSSFRKGNDLYQVESSGRGEQELLLADDHGKMPSSWSLDHRFLLYESSGGGGSLWFLPMSGDRRPVEYRPDRFSKRPGQFSPDGRWIAYVSNETGRSEVYVGSFPDRGGKWLVSTAGGAFPRWRRDGRELFYLAPNGDLMTAGVAQHGDAISITNVRTLFNPHLGRGRYLYDVTADGQRVLASTIDDSTLTPHINVVLRWTTAVKK